MRLQFSRRSDKDLDRLYEFLTEASHSIKTADKALKAIKDGSTSLAILATAPFRRFGPK